MLFNDFDEQQYLTLVEGDQLKRYRIAYSKSPENPSIPDSKLHDFLMNEFGISQTQAYYDMAIISKSKIQFEIGAMQKSTKPKQITANQMPKILFMPLFFLYKVGLQGLSNPSFYPRQGCQLQF